MDLVVPRGDEYLDEVVQHCFDEFGHWDSKADTARFFHERLFIPRYRDTTLLALEEGEFLGCAIFNTFGNRRSRTVQEHYIAAEMMNRFGLSQEKARRLISRKRVHYLQSFPHTLASPSNEDYYISYIVIVPEHRGKGLGTEMLTSLCDHIRARGGEQVFVHTSNEISQYLHERAGFQQILYLEPFYRNGKAATLMGKRLVE